MGEGFLASQAILKREDGGPGVDQWREEVWEGVVCGCLEADDDEFARANLVWGSSGLRVHPEITVGAQDLDSVGADRVEVGAEEEVDFMACPREAGAVVGAEGAAADDADLHGAGVSAREGIKMTTAPGRAGCR